MKKNTLLLLAALAAGGAFADRYWTGSTLSDWSAEGAWTGSGNNVFGGNGKYLTSTDPHVVLFSEPVIGLPGSANAAYTISETGVLSVTLSGLEKLVFNSDNVAWGAETAPSRRRRSR